MNLSLRCDRAIIDPNGYRNVTADLEGVDESELMDNLSVSDIIKHFSVESILEQIDVNEVMDYFDLIKPHTFDD